MSEIKIEAVVDHLDREFKKALDDVMAQFASNVTYGRDELFKYFLKRVYHHCNVWERIPESCIKD